MSPSLRKGHVFGLIKKLTEIKMTTHINKLTLFNEKANEKRLTVVVNLSARVVLD